MARELSVALIGIGGYGGVYASALLNAAAPNGHRLVAAVDPFPEASGHLPELTARNIPVYRSVEELYAGSNPARPDLVIVSSPIHLHARHTVAALVNGSNVLCEKPLCVTPQQASKMLQARDASGLQVSIGYQWSFSPAIQQLKRDVIAGDLGEPRRLTTMVLWPRDEMYYRRNKWAGKLYTGQGHPVFDSPVNNACAHYLHNMLYVLGDRTETSAVPARVTAELYRANGIETYDTAALRCWTERDVEIVFLVSHATRQSRGPVFRYEFSNAQVVYDEEADGQIVARFKDGSIRNYGKPPGGADMGKLWATIESLRAGTPPVCGIEAALPQMQVVCAAQQSTTDPVSFPASLVRVEGDPGSRRTWVNGLEDAMTLCYERACLPSECGLEWSAPAREVPIPTSGEPDSDLASEDPWATEPRRHARTLG